MLKLQRITKDAIKISIGNNFYDHYIMNGDEIYDYNMNIYHYTKPEDKLLTNEALEIKKMFLENKEKLLDFYTQWCGM